MKSRSARCLVAMVLSLVAVRSAEAAATDAQRCAAAKLKAAGKYAACILGADAKAESAAEAADYSKCETKQLDAWTKVEAKYGTACQSPGDQAAVQGDVAALAACLQGDLTDAPGECSVDALTDDLDTCAAGTATAADVRAGTTFSSSAGLGVTGTMPVRSSVAGVDGASVITIPDGFYSGGKTTSATDTDLVAANILAGVTIFGTTGTYSPPTCGNGVLDPDEDCDLGTLVGEACETVGYPGGVNASCTSDCKITGCYTRVFVTSTSVPGSFGGIEGGDALCQDQAEGAGLPRTWKAWLSTSTVSAADRIPDNEYRLVDGTTVIAHSKAELLPEDFTGFSLLASIRRDQNGTTRLPDVWTGTLREGTVDAATCDDWTSDAPGVLGKFGYSASTSQSWTQWGAEGCHTIKSLYCFEQPGIVVEPVWTDCADEGGICEFEGTKTVRFGDTSFAYITGMGPVSCDSTTFGGDPDPGVAKHCDFTDPY